MSAIRMHRSCAARAANPWRLTPTRALAGLLFLLGSCTASADDATGPAWLNAAAAEPMLVLGSQLASKHDAHAALRTESRLQRTLPGVLFDAGLNATQRAGTAGADREPRVVDAYDALRGTRS